MTENINELTLKITSSIQDYMQRQAEGRGPADHSEWNWASELHHPCKRFLFYARKNWKDRKPKTADSMFRLIEGIEQENRLVDLLNKAGYRVSLAQLPLRWDKFRIKGRIDGSIIIDRKEYPIEIKSISPWYWDQVRTIEEIKAHPKFWINRIPSQLNLYLLMKNSPAGVLILVTFGRAPRVLPMPLDYDLGEKDLQQAEFINEAVEQNKPPERIPYASDICGLCDFDHICQPLKFSEIKEASPEDVKKLKRYLELESSYREFNRLKAQLIGTKDRPGTFYGKNCIIEDIEVSSKEIEQTYYDVPNEVKSKYRKKRTIIRTKIGRIG